ncbi:Para-aminobenzoate synthase, aminase component [plant metagenome]|uniref:Para-aminobenzoate synthase, aminase component n=1 Tax=plant metagenome TaxID=1297885 RepID=A0A484RN73_9ZZZZ
MSISRFEDRLAGRAIVLAGLRERITACAPQDVAGALARIGAAQRAGRWVALLLDYELGEWLEPGVMLPGGAHAAGGVPAPGPSHAAAGTPRLTALVYERMHEEAPWTPSADEAGDGPVAPAVQAVQPRIGAARYCDNVRRIREWIAQGEVYQINYTHAADVGTQGAPDALYRRLAARHPSAHAAYVEDDGRTVLSFSPELFLQREGGTLTTRPMKGTAPRLPDPAADQASGQALLASEKNRAENLMIVDLLRNDLGRVARPGSVRVEALFTLERYPSVWTLTSTVRADAPDASLADILRALFPCGSVTGAPKIAAMRRIRELEDGPRGLYCGSIGWLAPNGDFSLNVAIRTLLLGSATQGVYHAGGGIVADSDPTQEWEECEWKSRVLTR